MAIALAIGVMQVPTLASDNNVASFAPVGESRYVAVAQATVAPTATPANNTQRIRQLETRVATLEQFRAADIRRIIALEQAVFGAPPPTLTPAPATPTVAPSVTPPASVTPAPSATPEPTTAPPTATPGATMPPHMGGFDCSVPAAQRNYLCGADISQPPSVMPDLRGQVCPAWVHDRYIVSAYQDARGEWVTREADSANVAPGAVVWRTWHPNTDAATGCTFQHEHGFDWRGHAAISTPPAFGLVGCLHWLAHGRPAENHCAEPHEGFKGYRLDAGYYEWFHGATSQHHSYFVAHFGTTSAGRFQREHHSMEFWQRSGRSDDPWRVHIMGMPSFGAAGNICERDAGALNIRGDGGYRVLGQVEPSGCPNNTNLYEIWFGQVFLREAGQRDPVASIGASFATKDPATVFRLLDAAPIGQRSAEVVPTGERGCKRDAYHEAVRYATYGNGPEALYTDMHGDAIAAGTFGGALQVFELPRETLSSGVGNGQVVFSRTNSGGTSNIMLIEEDRLTVNEPFGTGVHCYPSLTLPN